MIEKGEKVGTLYLCTSNIDSYISLASTGVDTTLWNHRLGHEWEGDADTSQNKFVAIS